MSTHSAGRLAATGAVHSLAMKGFLLGLLVAALAFAGYHTWQRRQPDTDTRKVAAAVDAAAPAKKRRKRPRGARLARPTASAERPGAPASQPEPEPEPDPEPEPVKLSAADLRIVGQGDDLGRPDVVKLDMADGKETRELSQDDIDARFRPQEGAILECISRARPDSETYVPGRVNIKFRIQRTGAVRGVRVEAPSILQKGGLYGCVKGLLMRLSFPQAGSSQLVSYPFTLS